MECAETATLRSSPDDLFATISSYARQRVDDELYSVAASYNEARLRLGYGTSPADSARIEALLKSATDTVDGLGNTVSFYSQLSAADNGVNGVDPAAFVQSGARQIFWAVSGSGSPNTSYLGQHTVDALNNLYYYKRIPKDAVLPTSLAPQALFGAGLVLPLGATLTLVDPATGVQTVITKAVRNNPSDWSTEDFTYTVVGPNGGAVVVSGTLSKDTKVDPTAGGGINGIASLRATAFPDADNLQNGVDVSAGVQAVLASNALVNGRGAASDLIRTYAKV